MSLIFDRWAVCNMCEQSPCVCPKDTDPPHRPTPAYQFETDDVIPQTYEPDPAVLRTMQAVKSCIHEWLPYTVGTYEKKFYDIRLKDGREYMYCWPNAGVFHGNGQHVKEEYITHVRISDPQIP